MAAEVGLTYHMDNAVVANSFKAHRFTHLAKTHNLGDAAEEALFKAYFTDGKNVDNTDTLVELAAAIGLDAEETRQTLATDAYSNDVKHDIAEAQYLGIQGVPFFVMNGKYGVSGAQAVPVFTQTLETAFGEWNNEQGKPKLNVIEGPTCGPDGDC
jgi:predicted DsbA family dithiol-disulfide isomerase